MRFETDSEYPGQRLTSIDRLEFSASDYFGLDNFAFGNVTAIIGGDVTGAITEDAPPISGRLTIQDPDPGQASFTAPAPSALLGTYGSFTFNAATGDWGYALNNAAANVQALAAGQVVQDQLNVTSLDGSSSRNLTVTVTGANDAPTLRAALADTATAEGAAFDYSLAVNSFGDIDFGDSLTFSANLANGNPLPHWLTFNAVTQSFTGTPGFDQASVLDVQVTATDALAASISDVFQITINEVSNRTALLVTFDDLASQVSPGYQGFNWTGRDPNYPMDWPYLGFYANDYESDGDQEAYTGFAPQFTTIMRSDGADFDVIFIEFGDGSTLNSEEYYQSDSIMATGSRDGSVIYSLNINLSDAGMAQETLNFMNIDRLDFEVVSGNYDGGRGWFSIDNLLFGV